MVCWLVKLFSSPLPIHISALRLFHFFEPSLDIKAPGMLARGLMYESYCQAHTGAPLLCLSLFSEAVRRLFPNVRIFSTSGTTRRLLFRGLQV
jgi:hypothetical protein